MSELSFYLRMQMQADKEAKITQVTASLGAAPTEFTSQLTSEQTRKKITVYNNSSNASGDCFFGFSSTGTSPSGESQPIPKGAMIDIPVAVSDDIDLYFMAASGEVGDLRVSEYA